MSNFQVIAKSVLSAKTAFDIFGDTKDHVSINNIYRNLAKVLHPDLHGDNSANKTLSEDAIRRLNVLHDEVLGKVAPSPKAPPIEITIKGKVYLVEDLICSGDIADIYDCHEKNDSTVNLILKACNTPSDNDLLENEANVYRKLIEYRNKKNDSIKRYIADYKESFVIKGDKGVNRKCNVIKKYSEYLSLAQVIEKRPTLDYRDIAWMMKRALEGLTYIHEAGIVHGAFIPEHFLIHPKNHGGKLIDWCYAVESGKEPIKAIIERYKHYYPNSVFKKIKANPQTDIYMVAETFLNMLDGKQPKEINTFFNHLRDSSGPKDCFTAYDEFNKLLQKLVGPPSYRELKL